MVENNPQYAIAQHLHESLHNDLIDLKNKLNKSVGDIDHIISKCNSIVSVTDEQTPLIEAIETHITTVKRTLRNSISHMTDLLDVAENCEKTIMFHETYY